MTPARHPAHGPEDLRPAGTELYERALREGHVTGTDAEAAPCLVDFGLLHPAVADLNRLVPIAPAVALHRLLRTTGERIALERRREQRLADTFEPLMRIRGRNTGADEAPTAIVLSGYDRIGRAIDEAMADSSGELLTIQPHGHRPAGMNA